MSVDGYTARQMLDAVAVWAWPDYWMMRETAACAPAGGRLDGLLVPRSMNADAMKRGARVRRGPEYWTTRACLVGVEIKASRADFLRGVREGQFERYRVSTPNLFVCTGRDVKTGELPEGVGHLVFYTPPGEQQDMGSWKKRLTHPEPRIACKRRPNYAQHEMDADTMWRVVMYCADQVRDAERERRAEEDRLFARLGLKVSDALRACTDSAGNKSCAGNSVWVP